MVLYLDDKGLETVMKKILQCALVGSILLGSVSASQAASVTFAQFVLGNGSKPNPFTYTGVNPISGDSTLKGVSVPVSFEYISTLGGTIGGASVTGFKFIDATLTFTGTATQGENPTFSFQNPFDTTSFTFTAVTNAQNTLDNISGKVLLAGKSGLTNSGAGGILTAVDNLGSPVFDASNPTGHGYEPLNPASSVLFTSQVIDTNNLIEQNFALSFSSAHNSSNGANGVTYTSFNSGNQRYLNSFTAAGTGTFAATSTPEPGVLAMLGAMFVGGAFGIRRRRK